MVVQYPHTADITQVTDVGTDSNGYPIPPMTETISVICRGEPNSRNAVINMPDGTAYQYSYTVYIKRGQVDVDIGSDITLHLSDRNISGKVKMYSRGQLNQRIWI